MRTLIIPCGGKGERLKDYFFPKCLLAVNQRPILFSIIEFWKENIDQVVIVLNKFNEKMIKEYVEKYYYDKELNIEYCLQGDGDGTYYAIKEGLKIAKNKEVILNWSDVLINNHAEDYSFLDINKNVVFTTTDTSCRWEYSDNMFINRGNCIADEGGIFGIFIIKDKGSLLHGDVNVGGNIGEVEILEKMFPEDFIDLRYEKFLDIGDSGKYASDKRTSSEGLRAFGSGNEIAIYDNLVIKKTSDEKLKRCEALWYEKNSFDFVPKHYGRDPLILEKIRGIPVSDYLEAHSSEDRLILDKMFNLLSKVHQSKGEVDADYNSSYDQYFGKTIKRLEKIDFLFSGFNKGSIIINGKSYENPLNILKRNEEKIKEMFSNKFRFIHGDLQTSNAMIDSDKNIYLIDPRGYFGETLLFGDPMYDFAKLYYGYCGMWDKFRQGKSEVCFDENSFVIKPLIAENEFRKRRDLFFELSEKINYVVITKEKIDFLHAIIWLSVADYISNDVLSSLYGYLNGIILINDIFNNNSNNEEI